MLPPLRWRRWPNEWSSNFFAPRRHDRGARRSFRLADALDRARAGGPGLQDCPRRRQRNDCAFPGSLAGIRDPDVQKDFDKVWLVGALLAVGDALGAHQYFGHIPEAEVIRHLRNGVAHGNKFRFEDRVKEATTGRLKHPANTARYAARQVMPVREVETHLQGTEVLFAWGGPDAVVDCLTVLGIHLWQFGHGLPCP